MPFYLNTITNEYEEINYSAVDYYLMRLEDNTFLFFVSEKNMVDHLNFNVISGTMKKFWMLTYEQVQTNLDLLFPENVARSSALTLQEVNTIHGIDLNTQDIEEFIKTRMELFCIENLSRNPQNHQQLHDGNFINASINILNTTHDVLTLNYAIRAIVNLSPTYMEIIRRKFCISKLVNLLDHHHQKTQKYAILALTIIYQKNITNADELINVHNNPNFLNSLLRLVQSTTPEIQQHALVVLYRMSSYIKARLYMCNYDVIRLIMSQLQLVKLESQKHIINILCNLTRAHLAHPILRDCNVIPILLDSALHSTYRYIKEQSTIALLFLSKDIKNHAIILAHNGYDILFELSQLGDANTIISESAICALMNLSLNADNELLQPQDQTTSLGMS